MVRDNGTAMHLWACTSYCDRNRKAEQRYMEWYDRATSPEQITRANLWYDRERARAIRQLHRRVRKAQACYPEA